LRGNKAYLAYYNQPAFAREGAKYAAIRRGEWSDAAFDLLAAHPDPGIREILAAGSASPQQRMRLLDDPDPDVRGALGEGLYWRWAKPQPLPPSVYERLAADPEPAVRMALARSRSAPRDVLALLTNDPDADVAARASAALRGPAESPPLSRERAEALARDDESWVRAQAAADPSLPADLVTALATDPSHDVRLAVSMRPELLCEKHADVPGELVLRTYLEARVITRSDLLHHPNFPRADLARLADSANWEARKLVVLDPGAPAALIERLSHDQHPGVRSPGWPMTRGCPAVGWSSCSTIRRPPGRPRPTRTCRSS
jgi:hypothetical protein